MECVNWMCAACLMLLTLWVVQYIGILPWKPPQGPLSIPFKSPALHIVPTHHITEEMAWVLNRAPDKSMQIQSAFASRPHRLLRTQRNVIYFNHWTLVDLSLDLTADLG